MRVHVCVSEVVVISLHCVTKRVQVQSLASKKTSVNTLIYSSSHLTFIQWGHSQLLHHQHAAIQKQGNHACGHLKNLLGKLFHNVVQIRFLSSYILGDIYKCTHLRISTHTATSEYASRVPMDIMSTRALRSNRKAMMAVGSKRFRLR